MTDVRRGVRGRVMHAEPWELVDGAPALWRKGSCGSDSATGSRFAERMLTVVASCRQQGRRRLDFLVTAGEATLQGTAAPSLLPTP